MSAGREDLSAEGTDRSAGPPAEADVPVLGIDDYRSRPLTRAYPDLDALSLRYFGAHQAGGEVDEIVECIRRLIPVDEGPRTLLLVGCGPRPRSLARLRGLGFEAVAVEPDAGYRQAACAYMEDPEAVREGAAEETGLPDASQRIVIMESVLEHVDSPMRSLSEAYRVLMPGGILFVRTTNRYRVSLRGENMEFRTPFLNWFPPILRECFVHRHLHFDPRLANFTPRPAVHWFCFSDLCQLGRQAGFARFYSRFDVTSEEAPSVRGSRLRRWFVRAFQRSTLVRALGLLQFGSDVYMWKRG